MNKIREDASRWDQYAEAFAIITTHFQSEVYRDIANELHGKVVDFGSGSAKIAPYLCEKHHIKSYTGVDAASVMVTLGNELINRLDISEAKLVHSTIEAFSEVGFDSAVSINSYYSWSEPMTVISCIYASLNFGANFFLVTPNPSLDMPRLLNCAKKEHIMNPAYKDFIDSNINFDKSLCDRFVSMDIIVEQCRKAGFSVVNCHQQYYLGGLNYLKLQKIAR